MENVQINTKRKQNENTKIIATTMWQLNMQFYLKFLFFYF